MTSLHSRIRRCPAILARVVALLAQVVVRLITVILSLLVRLVFHVLDQLRVRRVPYLHHSADAMIQPNASEDDKVTGATTTTELVATMETLTMRLVALQKGPPSSEQGCNELLCDVAGQLSTSSSPTILYLRIRELVRCIEVLESERRRLDYQ
ncbi:hypothetical protein SDRG_16012 [Saprolegnia diclina VS20]|uniref:Uncharacterized protein n=1 Tax=Saprolegnia diclina (strain VS20) TaxID=1156394 RepID=T0PYL3_SAPDV|nr:hypothetical protein SDRG_16012 [Saprolegnia diclina VS20]EQC26160.1 hypothetical protein SDRG_16012 [Saprolegnia diclina VS20]|eukprot:XP_008620423.1 hypothetical protein SDRG_16012 [Saprolegnia diclina VS20]